MFKANTFSPTESADFLSPDSFVSGIRTLEREKGGIAISDPSQGINIHTWQSSYDPPSGTIRLTNLDTAVVYNILTGIMSITDLSFAFDANMRPNLGYKLADGTSKIRYYDTVTETFITVTLPTGAGVPRLCHDDKRDEMVLLNVTDVLIFYLLDNVLYYLLQRERFEVPHRVATVTPGATLDKVGMSDDLRILAQISNGEFISSP